MKKILGLDLGTNSIGWALVNEAENTQEKSSINRIGVRIINYDNFVSRETGKEIKGDPADYFRAGKGVSPNAARTKSRSMRRNLQRYKLRRENLIEILKEYGFLNDNAILSENGNGTTFETYRLRAKAVTEEISLEQFARVLLMINKKRGYKSSRKAKGKDDGQLIDGIEIAKTLYDNNLTPGQFCLQLLQSDKKYLPDFYRSDLQAEFDRIWRCQKEFYPEILTDNLKEVLSGKNEKATWAICEKPFGIVGIKRETKGENLRIENFAWRVKALVEKMELEELAVVLQKVNGQINGSSGYLGAISDRSKELYFNHQTVGQYQMAILDKNPNASLRNMVFYRQDYLDEFNMIWDKQTEFHKELTIELKQEIRDVVIFYQRRLKSQKGLISFCEFESRQIEVEVAGKKKTITVGNRVIPRSSPLFDEFRKWQILNNLEVLVKGRKNNKNKQYNTPGLSTEKEDPLEIYGKRELYQEEKELLAKELSIREKLTKAEILKLLFDNPEELDLNFPSVEGNRTCTVLYKAFGDIIHRSGHEIDFKKPASDIIRTIKEIFTSLNWNTDILQFNSNAKNLDIEPMYKLWHLLYSFEGDNSNTGNENLINKITDLYGFEKEYSTILANVTFQDDYGNLSAKAIRKILPFLKEGHKYDIACGYAGYRHSKSSLTSEELSNKVYKDYLDILPKNSLRNPVVEKILNQMINVINTIIDVYGKKDEKGKVIEKPFDEIRLELARELKKNAEEREKLTKAIGKTTTENEEYRVILAKSPFNLTYISRNDIIRYKLYKELEQNGFHTLYSNTYISPIALFSGDFDIEHIIPQAQLFDDSFSNKTLELRSINLEKGNKTAFDFIKDKYGETGKENSLDNYLSRIETLHKQGIISKTKFKHLTWKECDIPGDFLNRDLGNTQYISKYARAMLNTLVPRVVATTGLITERLREDWQLVDIMKELNWEKYKKLGLTEEFTKTDYNGNMVRIQKIKDWTKRNDHRHHAMDALTVAFTKDAYIQLLNNLHSATTPNSATYALKQLYIENSRMKPPIPLNEFRAEAKRHLENTLISIKAKNKIFTKNLNKTKKNNGTNIKVQLTPRGQLHLETVYGSKRQYVIKEEKVGTNFDEAKILTVSKSVQRDALLKRLRENDNDPKKAFGGKNAPAKKPIFIDETKTILLPERVKTVTFETVYTIRKEISPDLKLEKIIDVGIRNILEKRLQEYGGDFKKAFSNLEENPVWLNKAKGISVKRVIISGISNGEPLHEKKDKDGKPILGGEGRRVPVDFVNTGNNHHIAVYRDADGNLQENVVSFYEAVARRNSGMAIIDKQYKQSEGWQFLFSMKQNEYFVFPNEKTGFDPRDMDLIDSENYALISQNLFRVVRISKVFYGNTAVRDYWFRHHLETNANVEKVKELRDVSYKVIKSMPYFEGIVKVRINHIGQIVGVGEY